MIVGEVVVGVEVRVDIILQCLIHALYSSRPNLPLYTFTPEPTFHSPHFQGPPPCLSSIEVECSTLAVA